MGEKGGVVWRRGPGPEIDEDDAHAVQGVVEDRGEKPRFAGPEKGVGSIFMDFGRGAARHHKTIFYAMMALFVLCMVPVSYLMLRHIWI